MSKAQVFYEAHQGTLEQAMATNRSREFWSPYPEAASGRIYGETANVDGRACFDGYLGRHFELAVPAVAQQVGEEESPYGLALNVGYDRPDTEALIARMQAALPAWRDAGPQARAGVCLEILDRLNKRSFEMAYAVMHTTGQGFMMAFQAGGPHAQDRGLEAVARAFSEMQQVPHSASWVKPQGKQPALAMQKTFRVVPKGISLVVACATFPTWNTYPGLFASLVTGNPVIIKPHPGAVLPVAISVQIAQQVLTEAGFDPCLVSMVPDSKAQPITKELAQHPAVRLIDFTGSSAFGNWLEQNCPQAEVFTEKSGVNTIIIDSVQSMKAVARNLTFTLSLYSGQMCTTPQAIYIPRDGIETADGRLSFDEVAEFLAGGIAKFTANTEVAVSVLGAIQSTDTQARIDDCAKLGEVVLASQALEHPDFPHARIRTPMLLKVDATDIDSYSEERFGPISFLIATDNTAHSLELARQVISEKGAITLGVYSTDEAVLDQAEALSLDVKVALSCNLTGGVFVNQSAAFSDFHATGGNPAANASLTDGAFVSRRFVVVQSRRDVPPPAA
ncbi:phenylacetic acid degradation protein PaaN [Marinobacterium sedimentorum]|uniref:phenylacetic acid degradation protein PaaN n=1 Tax=Marinobacterium sedimentorum TaxID=2927804 RepID=UPI0020C62132|nr:phenylacetic acid degradation protein PaaN [Marinobacterium sedimentorum]MCP8686563.1 phenylacetic acid degradation protein PaaN [Marinobacterium sedimentorum]